MPFSTSAQVKGLAQKWNAESASLDLLELQNTIQSLTFDTFSNILVFLPVAVKFLPSTYTNLIQSKPAASSSSANQNINQALQLIAQSTSQITLFQSEYTTQAGVYSAGNNSAYSESSHLSDKHKWQGDLNAQYKLNQISTFNNTIKFLKC